MRPLNPAELALLGAVAFLLVVTLLVVRSKKKAH